MAGLTFTRPAEGVVLYRVPKSGALVLLTHHYADPLKRSKKWRAEVASDFAEGEQDPGFQEEYDLNFEARRGTLIYHAYSADYSIVEPFDDIIGRGFTRWSLGLDFGDHASCLFFAQHPKTQQIIAFDELYWYKETVATMTREIYEVTAKHRGALQDMTVNDVYEDIIGDPRGAGLAREYGQSDFPVQIRTGGHKVPWKLDDHRLGWKRVNDSMLPGFWHCGKRQHTKGKKPFGMCAMCNKGSFKAEPLLVFMEDRTPNLIRTWPEQILKRAQQSGKEEPEQEEAGLEDHLWDCVRYKVMGTIFERPTGASQPDILTMPVHQMTVEDIFYRKRMESAKRGEREREVGLRDEKGHVISLGVDEWGREVLLGGGEDEPDIYVPGLDDGGHASFYEEEDF